MQEWRRPDAGVASIATIFTLLSSISGNDHAYYSPTVSVTISNSLWSKGDYRMVIFTESVRRVDLTELFMSYDSSKSW